MPSQGPLTQFAFHETALDLASPAGVFRGDRISSLPTGGREEIRSPLKTPAEEATLDLAF